VRDCPRGHIANACELRAVPVHEHESVAAVTQVLETQRQGLMLLQEIIRKDARDLQLMLELLGNGDITETVRRVIADVAGGSKGYSDVQYAMLGRSDVHAGHPGGSAPVSRLFLTG
jgi:hypothetical protein